MERRLGATVTKLLRIVVVGKHSYNDHKTVKAAVDVCRRNVKAGYKAYITEPEEKK